MPKKINILLHPVFLLGLLVLILNDHVLKQQYHNTVTGKLSDFMGLFIFPLFWAALLPKFRKAVYTITALLFIYWKSSWSQPFVDWLSVQHIPITRVVDYTDLIALSVLPISYQFFVKTRPSDRKHILVVPMAIISFIAFCATSTPPNYTPCDSQFYYGKWFSVEMTLEEVQAELNNLGLTYDIDTISKHTYPYSINTDTSCSSEVKDYIRPQSYFVIRNFQYHGDTINTIYISYSTYILNEGKRKEQPVVALMVRGYKANSIDITNDNVKLYKSVQKRMDKLIKEGIVQPLKDKR